MGNAVNTTEGQGLPGRWAHSVQGISSWEEWWAGEKMRSYSSSVEMYGETKDDDTTLANSPKHCKQSFNPSFFSWLDSNTLGINSSKYGHVQPVLSLATKTC